MWNVLCWCTLSLVHLFGVGRGSVESWLPGLVLTMMEFAHRAIESTVLEAFCPAAPVFGRHVVSVLYRFFDGEACTGGSGCRPFQAFLKNEPCPQNHVSPSFPESLYFSYCKVSCMPPDVCLLVCCNMVFATLTISQSRDKVMPVRPAAS